MKVGFGNVKRQICSKQARIFRIRFEKTISTRLKLIAPCGLCAFRFDLITFVVSEHARLGAVECLAKMLDSMVVCSIIAPYLDEEVT